MLSKINTAALATTEKEHKGFTIVVQDESILYIMFLLKENYGFQKGLDL